MEEWNMEQTSESRGRWRCLVVMAVVENRSEQIEGAACTGLNARSMNDFEMCVSILLFAFNYVQHSAGCKARC